jgi:hypothetical protein
MAFSIRNQKIDKETFDRLYEDAYPYSEAERERVGNDELKEGMWELHNDPDKTPLTYFKDNHVVGCASVDLIPYEEKQFLLQRYVLVGRDNDGSRAWFYSPEFKEEVDNIITALNGVGLLVIRSNTSPVGIASKNVLPFELTLSKEIQENPEKFPANAIFSVYRKVT